MNAARSETFHPVTNAFLDSVLRLEPRVAAFDCDGTLWAGDAGERFFDWELRERQSWHRSIVRPLRERYAAYKRGEVGRTTMCGEMVTMHRGISESKMMEAAVRLLRLSFRRLRFSRNARVGASSARKWLRSLGGFVSNEWVIRAAMKHFGIPETEYSQPS